MVDFEKVQQAKELLEESGAKYVLAWQNEECTGAKGSIVGSLEDVFNNVFCVLESIIGAAAEDDWGREELEGLLHSALEDVFNKVYKSTEGSAEH